jgi:predicted NBD/HSP70 family sugar kinase
MSEGWHGRPAHLRVLNDRAALALLLEAGPLTRNEIARRTGLSKPTAAEIIRRLEAAGLLRESGVEAGGRRGPNAVTYEAIVDDRLAVAVDVQFVDVRSRVVDALGREHPVAVHRMTAEEIDSDAVDILGAAIERAAAAAGIPADDVTAVGVGVQASVDHAADRLIFTDGLAGWPREQVAGTLADALGVRVEVENDANLAAIAERRSGTGRDAASFALLWLAEGLGVALDIAGRVHSGASGAAGETGYLAVPSDAAALEPDADVIADLVSETALVRLAARHGVTGPDGDGSWAGVLAALPALDDGHPLFAELAERVGHNALPVLAVADPDVIILHGPTGIAGGEPLARATTRWLRARTRWATEAVAPGVTEFPVLRGAGDLLVDRIRTAMAESVSALDPEPSPS